MDIEKKKTEIFASLMELEADIKTLSDRIAKTYEDLANVHTMDDAKAFNESHNLEEGLKHIELF